MKEQIDNKIIEPNQWVYVIEKGKNQLKVGVTTDLDSRLKMLERLGGFHILRKQIFGPFHNGYQVENEIHKCLNPYSLIGEWFSVDYEYAVSIATVVAGCSGNTKELKAPKEPNYEEVLDWLFTLPKDVVSIKNILDDASFRLFQDKNGVVWLEHDDYGIFILDFLDAFMRTTGSEYAKEEKCYDHK
jgi:hypothetical protein